MNTEDKSYKKTHGGKEMYVLELKSELRGREECCYVSWAK